MLIILKKNAQNENRNSIFREQQDNFYKNVHEDTKSQYSLSKKQKIIIDDLTIRDKLNTQKLLVSCQE